MELKDTSLFSSREFGITEETVFYILGNQRRRLVVYVLKEESGGEGVEVGTLARRISAWENDVPGSEVDYGDRKSVYTSLQQHHLPEMDEAGIVDFDERKGVVSTTNMADEFTVYLEIVNSKDIPWHGYYLGLGAIGGSLLVALLLNASPFTQLPDLAWTAFLVVALLVSALVHTYTARRRRVGNDGSPPGV
jgi:DNA-binding transcriptional ArsR family regulator